MVKHRVDSSPELGVNPSAGGDRSLGTSSSHRAFRTGMGGRGRKKEASFQSLDLVAPVATVSSRAKGPACTRKNKHKFQSCTSLLLVTKFIYLIKSNLILIAPDNL